MAKDEKEKDKEKEDQEEAGEGAEGGEAAEGEGGEGGGGGKSKKKLFIIIGLLVIILAAVPVALWKLGILGGHKKEAGPVGAAEGGGVVVNADGTVQPEQIVYYDMEEFIVNLSVGGKRPSFLKMTISLELPGESQIPFIEAKLPRIRDGFQIYLRELRAEDLQGSAGIYRLREELLLRINRIVYPSKVNDILFKEILIQ